MFIGNGIARLLFTGPNHLGTLPLANAPQTAKERPLPSTNWMLHPGALELLWLVFVHETDITDEP